MTINLSNQLIGLSILGGTNSISSYYGTSVETPAVTAAKKAFTTPETTPPWQDEETSSTPISAQAATIMRLSSIIDDSSDNSLEDLPDVQTAFTTYKALDKLRILAEAASSKTITDAERASLTKAFNEGLTEIQSYLGQAETDLLNLNFSSGSSRAQSIGIEPGGSSNTVTANGVSKQRSDALSGLIGAEIFSVTLTRGAKTETVTVDLSTTTQPPTLDSVAEALNAAIGATLATDGDGNLILDEDGAPQSLWQSRFSVTKTDDLWGLTFKTSGIETASIDQVNSSDALMIVSGRTAESGPTSAQILRIDDPATALGAVRLSTINAIDTDATATAKAQAAAEAQKAGDDSEPDDPTVYAASSAQAIVTDAQGFSYIVGTTSGDLGATLSDGEDDLYLTKVNSEGEIVWQRSLGAAGSAKGAAITIADNGDIVVAGSVSGAFSGSLDTEQTDMLVARFSSDGTEEYATAIRASGNETSTAITIGADGSVYVAGQASTGKGDAVILRLDAAGKLQERRKIDSGASDTITALEIDADGNLLALAKQDGVASLLRIDGSSLATDLESIILGTVDARAIAISDNGEIAIVGATSTTVNGDQNNSISGGRDAFVTQIASDFSSLSTSYIGASEDDQADSVTYMNGALYVGGRTKGALEGSLSGKTDAFVARINVTTGATEEIDQWGLISHTAEPVKIAAVTGGATSLSALGLERGEISQTVSFSLTDQTALREGDSFDIRVDGGTAHTITIDKDETMSSLAIKIQTITKTSATAVTSRSDGSQVLRIQAATGHKIELIAGSNGSDALSKLGMAPTKLTAVEPKDKDAPKVSPGGTYNLLLNNKLSLNSEELALAALEKIKSAQSMTQSAYRSLYWDSTKEATVNGTLITGNSGTAYQQSRLAQYEAALSRLTT